MPRNRRYLTRPQLVKGSTGNGGQRETRIVFGKRCTWWGRVQDAKTTSEHIPICPNCRGPLIQVPSEAHFFAAVKMFEEGGERFQRPHPGYTDFMRWMRHRCFNDIVLATTMYKASTGIDIDLQPDEFGYGDEDG